MGLKLGMQLPSNESRPVFEKGILLLMLLLQQMALLTLTGLPAGAIRQRTAFKGNVAGLHHWSATSWETQAQAYEKA